MGKGYLTISVRTADDALPISDAKITIFDKHHNVLYQTLTDENGNTDKFLLDAPDKSLSFDKAEKALPYSEFDVDVEKSGFFVIHIHDVEVFDEVTAILPVELHPDYEDNPQDEHIHITENSLRLPTEQRQFGSNQFQLREVFIPEYITVHLGLPTNSAARNIKVKFADYIKNVASSEIYPTWPTNSLIANIHVIVTFAINRVYTEWYPSRGYAFDITNSTAYDQYFVEGRNIFANISTLVDNYFNVFARRQGYRNPFFTQYCSGTTATCQGLSQWGTVELANLGFSPIQILRYYYPNDIELIETNNIQAITASYPGYPLRLGSSGISVQRMQNFLNRIRLNYPLIQQISNPNGVFGNDMDSAVRTFQRSFNMVVDGVIGKATWNKITQIYVGVIRLAELDSEGERETIGEYPPNVVLRQGSSGSYVSQLQFLLNFISPFYDSVSSVIADGVFGPKTKNAVISFQKTFGLTQDGIVGPLTWNKLYAVYKGIRDNVLIPPQTDIPANAKVPYPGYPLSLHSTGSNVRLMQNYLNTIRIVYNSIPQLVADGIFGNNTKNAVIAFQKQFFLSPDGIIGPITWDAIVEQYILTSGRG